MNILNVTQGSEQWLSARAGKHKSSRTHDLMPLKSGSYGATRKNYETEVACEVLTSRIEPLFTTAAMQRGIDYQHKAQQAFELVVGDVENVGLVIHPKNERFVASPDGLVKGEKSLIEIKVPNSATHLEYILKDEVPVRYLHQIQAQLACTQYDACYFVSWDDRVPAELQLFIKKVQRDDKLIAQIEKEVETFLAGVDEMVSALKSKMREAA